MSENLHHFGLRAILREDWLTNGEDRTRPGYRALRMYRFGVWRLTIRNAVFRKPMSLLYRLMHRRVRNRYGIELHDTARIGRRLLIAHQGAIVIHEHATIGDDCIIRQGVTIGAAGRYSMEDAPVIGDRVSIGAGAMILGRVTIGSDVNIGPNAVVMTNVPDGAIVAAPPARIIPAPSPRAREDATLDSIPA